MAKFDPKDILKRVKSKTRPNKVNVTFRLDPKLMEKFKAACEKQGVTSTAVIEEFIEAFVNE